LISPTSVAENPPVPEKIEIFNSYPNPFNGSSTIRYRLTEPADVNLSIYNLRGQKVYNLVEGRFDAGIHSVDWNAPDVPSGVYFARLVAGSETKSLKISLLK